MNNRFKTMLFSVVLTCAGMSAATIDEYLATVAAGNPDLKVLRQEMIAAGYDLEQLNTPDATSIEYSPFFRRGYDGVASSELIVSQELDFPTLYAGRAKSAKLQKEGMESEYSLRLRDFLYEGAENYLQLVRLTKERKILTKQLESLHEIAQLTEKKMNSGDVTSLDFNRLKIQIMELESSLVNNETERVAIYNAMKMLNGFQDFTEDVNYPDWQLPQETVGQLAASDVTVKKSEADLKTMQQEERVARQEWLPKLTLGYRRNTEADEGFNGMIVGASFPLFSVGKKVKAAKARKAAAVMEAENARVKAENEFDNAIKEVSLIQRSMATYNLGLLDETAALLLKSVELGNITYTDYILEIIQLNEKRSAYFDLEYDYYRKLAIIYRNSLIRVVRG